MLTRDLDQIDQARPFDCVLPDIPVPEEFRRKPGER